MKPYCWHKKNGSSKLHPADKCDICAENAKNTKTARRMKDKSELKKELEEYYGNFSNKNEKRT